MTSPSPGPGAVVAAVHGIGATGARAARVLAGSPRVGSVVLGGPGVRPEALARAMGAGAEGTVAVVADPLAADASVVVLAGPPGSHVDEARRAVAARCHVVSCSDANDDVTGLQALHADAVAAGVSVVIGAGFGPGLSCVLAAHAAGWMDQVEEIHLARFGTGGPACARGHQVALKGRSVDWRDGEWVRRPGGSGRELSVFPDPVGSLDCYRAALPDALLLHPVFPDAVRITARQAANRRQRLLAWAPMLRRPHPEGRIGAIRVEVRGYRDGASVTEVVGAIDRPAVAAGAVAGVAARWALEGRIAPGAGGLAGRVDTIGFLDELTGHGVRAAVFVGAG